MALKKVRVGANVDAFQFDDGDYSEAIDTDSIPINTGTATQPAHAIRLDQLPTLGNVTSADAVIADNAIVRGDGGARKIQGSSLFLDDSGNLSKAVADLDLDCGANKTLRMVQSLWDDLRIVPGSFDRVGASDPAIQAITPGAGTTTYLWEFAKNDIVSFTAQLPHTYKQGEDISVHLHWTPGPWGVAENGNTVGWKVQYTWANIDGTFGAMVTADLSDACDGTDYKHQKTPAVTITGTGKTISSMLICNLTRTDTGADDTWSSAVPGEQPMILEVDFHFPIDTVGSRQIGTK